MPDAFDKLGGGTAVAEPPSGDAFDRLAAAGDAFDRLAPAPLAQGPAGARNVEPAPPEPRPAAPPAFPGIGPMSYGQPDWRNRPIPAQLPPVDPAKAIADWPASKFAPEKAPMGLSDMGHLWAVAGKAAYDAATPRQVSAEERYAASGAGRSLEDEQKAQAGDAEAAQRVAGFNARREAAQKRIEEIEKPWSDPPKDSSERMAQAVGGAAVGIPKFMAMLKAMMTMTGGWKVPTQFGGMNLGFRERVFKAAEGVLEMTAAGVGLGAPEGGPGHPAEALAMGVAFKAGEVGRLFPLSAWGKSVTSIIGSGLAGAGTTAATGGDAETVVAMALLPLAMAGAHGGYERVLRAAYPTLEPGTAKWMAKELAKLPKPDLKAEAEGAARLRPEGEVPIATPPEAPLGGLAEAREQVIRDRAGEPMPTETRQEAPGTPRPAEAPVVPPPPVEAVAPLPAKPVAPAEAKNPADMTYGELLDHADRLGMSVGGGTRAEILARIEAAGRPPEVPISAISAGSAPDAAGGAEVPRTSPAGDAVGRLDPISFLYKYDRNGSVKLFAKMNNLPEEVAGKIVADAETRVGKTTEEGKVQGISEALTNSLHDYLFTKTGGEAPPAKRSIYPEAEPAPAAPKPAPRPAEPPVRIPKAAESEAAAASMGRPPSPNRDRVKSEAVANMGLRPDEAEAVLSLYDAIAQHATRAGKIASPDEFYRGLSVERATPAQEAVAGARQGDRAFIDFPGGGRGIIRALKTADVSSLAHEMTHFARPILENWFPEDMAAIRKFLGVKEGGKWERGHEERFARAFERYLRDGQAPTKALAAVFERMKNWLRAIYKSVAGGKLDAKSLGLTEGELTTVRAIFDRMLGSKKTLKQAFEEGKLLEDTRKAGRQRTELAKQVKDDVSKYAETTDAAMKENARSQTAAESGTDLSESHVWGRKGLLDNLRGDLESEMQARGRTDLSDEAIIKYAASEYGIRIGSGTGEEVFGTMGGAREYLDFLKGGKQEAMPDADLSAAEEGAMYAGDYEAQARIQIMLEMRSDRETPRGDVAAEVRDRAAALKTEAEAQQSRADEGDMPPFQGPADGGNLAQTDLFGKSTGNLLDVGGPRKAPPPEPGRAKTKAEIELERIRAKFPTQRETLFQGRIVQMFEPDKIIDDARFIEPFHEVRNQEKVLALVEDMKKNGWRGRPLLVFDDGNGLHALTGVHRLAAAKATDTPVPVVKADFEKLETRAREEGVSILDLGNEETRLEYAEQAGDKISADLIREEIRVNEDAQDRSVLFQEQAGKEDRIAQIANEPVGRILDEMALPRPTKADRLDFEQAHKYAQDEFRADPEAGRKLVASLETSMRPPTGRENAVLTWEWNRLLDARDKAEAKADSLVNGDKQAFAEALAAKEKVALDFEAVSNVLDWAGTESSYSLGMRRLRLTQQYTLAAMERTARIATAERPPAEVDRAVAEVKKLSDQLREAEKRGEEWRTQKEAADAAREKAETDLALARKMAEVEKENRTPGGPARVVVNRKDWRTAPKVRPMLDRLKAMQAAGKTLMQESSSPAAEPTLADVAHESIRFGAKDFANWEQGMVEALGEGVRAKLGAAWDEGQQRNRIYRRWEVGKRAGKRAAEKGSPTDIGQAAEEIGRTLYADGIRDREALIDGIHAELKKYIPGITRDQTQQAFSRYGEYKEASKEETAVFIRDMKRQVQLQLAIADWISGKGAKPTGWGRGEVTDEQRRLIRLRDEAKKNAPPGAVDREGRLKSALQTAKTIFENEIRDMDRQLATGKQDVPNRVKLELDPEAQSLKARRDALREMYNEVFGNRELTDAQRLDLWKKRARESIGEYERRVAKEDFGPRPKPQTPKLDQEGIAIEFAKFQARQRFQELQIQWQRANRGTLEKAGEIIVKPYTVTRSLMAAFDNSFFGRQGWKALFTSDIPDLASIPLRAIGLNVRGQGGPRFIWSRTFARSWKMAWDTFGGKNVMDAVTHEIQNGPNYQLKVKAGLDIGGKPEEVFQGIKTIDRIAGWGTKAGGGMVGRVGRQTVALPATLYKASESMFTGSARLMRSRLFDLEIAIGKKSGMNLADPRVAKALARMTNSLTARGAMKHHPWISAVLWTPKMFLGAIDVLTLHGRDVFGKKADRMPLAVRKRAAIQLVQIVGGMASIQALAAMIDPDSVDWDPRSANFGKIKIGDTRIDFTGGMGSILTLAARLASVSTKSSTTGKVTKLNEGGWNAKTMLGVLSDYWQNKLAPVPGIVVQHLEGRDRNAPPGKPVPPTILGSVGRLYTPMPFSNAWETFKNPKSAPLLLTMILDGLGFSANTYSAAPAKPKKSAASPMKATAPSKRAFD